MWEKLKKIGCYLTIIVLLPYVVTVFINGPSIVTSSHVDGTYIQVKTEQNEITELPIEDYCIGIMAREMLPEYEKEALKAQAVLVRTEVYRKIEADGSNAVLETPFWTQKQMEEAWGVARYTRYYNKLKNAWRNTEGQVLMYEEKLAKTPFFRLSNGSTRDGKEVLGEQYPYLKIVECPADIEVEEQIQTVTMEDMDAEVLKCDTAGYVLSVRIGKETVSGEEFRNQYGLASSCFTLQKYNGKLRITTRGEGHGLGMSQNTANVMAKEGRSYQEILEYFFNGASMKEVAEIVQLEHDEKRIESNE